MMFLTNRIVAVAALLAVGAIAGPAQADKKLKKSTLRIDAVLESVDVKQRTITVTTGKSVDEALGEKLEGITKKADESEKQTLPLTKGAADITLCFRRSPSVANTTPRTLTELERMAGYPVSLELTVEGDRIVVTKIIAWRGGGDFYVSPQQVVALMMQLEELQAQVKQLQAELRQLKNLGESKPASNPFGVFGK